MMSPLDTHIAFFGGAAKPAVIDAVVKLADAGYDVVVASHDPREAVEFRNAGIPLVEDRVEAVRGCEVIITSLSNPGQVEDLYLGDNGLLELMEPGAYAIDLSFSTPQLAREIEAMAAVSDIEVLDAPVVNLGEHEEAMVFVGGNPKTIETLSPLFPYLGASVLPQSAPGEGQFAAMISYISLAGSLMGAIEAMSLAHIAGFPEKAALNALASSAGGSWALVEYAPKMLAHDYSGHIKVTEFMDALEVALDAADALEVTVPMIETAYQLYELLSVVGGDGLNIQALALLYEDEKTCADYGLDWALAETAAPGQDGSGFNMDDFFHGQGGEGPDMGAGPRGGAGGPQWGEPPISGFFSKN